MIATKDQERKAIEEIRKIVESLGENSYVGAAMDGVLELAEDNINNDFTQSMKDRIKEVEEELKKAKECVLPEETRMKFYNIAFDEKYKAQEAAMAAAERMAEAIESGRSAKADAIRYRDMTFEIKEWKDIIMFLDDAGRKQAGR